MCSSPNIHLFAGVCHCLTRSYLFKQWDQLRGRAPGWLFIFICMSFQSSSPLQFAKDVKKKKKHKPPVVSLPICENSLPNGEGWKSQELRQGPTKQNIFQLHRIAAKGRNMTATVFEFQLPILFRVTDRIISIPCLGFDLLSDLWIWVPESAALTSNSPFLYCAYCTQDIGPRAWALVALEVSVALTQRSPLFES